MGYYCFGASKYYIHGVKRILLILHWMNFDTALGAAITSLFIAKYIGSVVPVVATSALFVSVLAIYNFDHLLDAKKIVGIALSARHRFYQRNLKVLSVYQMAILLILLVNCWFLPAIIAKAGIILAVIALIYFLLLFIVLPNRFVFKEVMIAAVFVSGLFLASIVVSSLHTISLPMFLLWLQVFLLALINTLIISWFDYEYDLKEGHTSLAQILGKNNVRQISFILLTILLLIIVFSLLNGDLWQDQAIIACMGMVLMFCLVLSKKVHANEVFRLLVEAIFLIPILRFL